MAKLNYKRSTVVLLLAAVFVLGIPSLPGRPYHPAYWATAFLIEAVVIYVLWPLGSD